MPCWISETGLWLMETRNAGFGALTDSQTGSGALALGIIITLLSVISLGSLQSDNYMAFSLIFAETGSKMGNGTHHHIRKTFFMREFTPHYIIMPKPGFCYLQQFC